MPSSTSVAIAIVGGSISLAALAFLARRRDGTTSTPPWRTAAVRRALQHAAAHTPYQWAGGHGAPSWGLDCSGLVNDAAASAGISLGMSSNQMGTELDPVASPLPADLALYGEAGRAVHVRLVEAFDPSSGVASTIGSEGGDRSTTTPERAAEQGAFVRRVPDHRSPAFLGFRSLAARPRSAKVSPVLWSEPG